jgi:hypothetical protein
LGGSFSPHWRALLSKARYLMLSLLIGGRTEDPRSSCRDAAALGRRSGKTLTTLQLHEFQAGSDTIPLAEVWFRLPIVQEKMNKDGGWIRRLRLRVIA